MVSRESAETLYAAARPTAGDARMAPSYYGLLRRRYCIRQPRLCLAEDVTYTNYLPLNKFCD